MDDVADAARPGHDLAVGDVAAPSPPFPATPRRRFLGRLSAICGAVAAAAVGVPILGFFFEPVVRRPSEQWRAIGPVTAFRSGETVQVSFADAAPVPWAGPTSQTGAWLRRAASGEFTAFALNCTHLGCPVRWMAGARLFMCPCHGGVYYEDGAVAAGPPPRALSQYAVQVREGIVCIRTSPLPLP
jgi:menaquinol-cytochrome c reductase iron-sulfur subunit